MIIGRSAKAFQVRGRSTGETGEQFTVLRD